jgi:outer membrane usher protein
MFPFPLSKALAALLLLTPQVYAQAIPQGFKPHQPIDNTFTASADRILHLEIIINEQPKKMVAKFKHDQAGRLWAEAKELREIGLKTPEGAKDNTLIALNSLQGISYILDEPTQSLRIAATDRAQEATLYRADMFGKEQEKIVAKRDFGAVVNYSVYSSVSQNFNGQGANGQSTQFSGASGTIDSRVFGPGGTLASSFMVGNATTLKRPDVVRLDTSWSYTNPESLMTYRAGDIISSGHSWTRPLRLGGIQVSRNFNLRPDLISTAMPGVSGSAAVPSVVDVYVNNTKTFTQDVAPGPFKISNLPVLGSNGTARVVITEPSGRVTETTQSFFVNSRILAKGNFDYSLEGGFARLEYGTNSSNYVKQFALVASSRYGLADNLTLETYGETTDKFVNVGAGLATSFAQRHLFTLAGQVSKNDKFKGANLHASYETQFANKVFLSASTQRSIGDYYDLAAATAKPLTYNYNVPFNPFAPPGTGGTNTAYSAINQSLLVPKAMDRVTVGMPLDFLGNATFSTSYIHLLTSENVRSHLINATLHKNFSNNISAYTTVYADRGDKRNIGFYAGLTVPFGKDNNSSFASLGVSSDQGGSYVTADYVKPLDQKVDSWGFRLRDVEGKSSYRSASISNRNAYSKAEVTVSQMQSGVYGTAYIEGAVAAAGGGVFLANRIDDSFAVVNAGSPNVEVYAENRLVGKTGSSGRILIPQLRSYETNRVTINPVDLPLNASIETTKTLAVPVDRGVSVVNFGVITNPMAATVIFKTRDGKAIGAGASGQQQNGESFIVGYDGRAYLKGLQSNNSVSINYAKGTCQANFAYQTNDKQMVTIGPVICE